MSSAKVLVVDDERGVASLFQEWLEEEGHEVTCAGDGQEGWRMFFEQRPALNIVDLRMPGMDGFQLIGRIREVSDSHVIVLTALGGDDHVIRGLDAGADNYLVKPVSKRVLQARVRSILKRTAASPNEAASRYSDSALTVDYLTYEAVVRGRTVYLRPTEFRLLVFLVENRDRVLSHQEILDGAWGDEGGSLDSLKWYVAALREKLEQNPQSPELLITVPRVGYRYMPPGPPA